MQTPAQRTVANNPPTQPGVQRESDVAPVGAGPAALRPSAPGRGVSGGVASGAGPPGAGPSVPAGLRGPQAQALVSAAPLPAGAGALLQAPSVAAVASVGAPLPAAGGPTLLMPEAPSSLSPGAEARLDLAQQQVGAASMTHATLPSAEEGVQAARDGVTEPQEQADAQAGGATAAALDDRPAPAPEIEALCERVQQCIRDKRPPDEASLAQADPQAMAAAAGAQLDSSIQGDAERVETQYDALDTAPAGVPSQLGEAIEQPPGDVDVAPILVEQATPDAIPAEDVSLDADLASAERQLQTAGMETEPAKLVQDGLIGEARGTVSEMGGLASAGPAEVLMQQQVALQSAQGDMVALRTAAVTALQTSRLQAIAGTGQQQHTMVPAEQMTRREAGLAMQRIYDNAQQQVNGLLEPLAGNALAKWDAGVAVLSHNFRAALATVAGWLEERYSGVVGSMIEFAESFIGLPDWIVRAYDRAEKDFADGACALIRDISRDVEQVVSTCEQLISGARTEIDQLVSGLPEELRAWAEGERERMQLQLDALGARAASTRDEVNGKLVQRASEAVQEVREEVHGLRERAKGLLGKLGEQVASFLTDPARFIVNGLLQLVGISPPAFWGIVDQLGGVVQAIADDPIGFAGNLAAALGQGFSQFFGNFGGHFTDGLLEWLFSGLGAVGVEAPPDFSLKSVVTFFLQVMGVTWTRIRSLLVQHLGEENVALLEGGFGLLQELLAQGPGGIWELLKERLDPAAILQMVMDAALNYVMDVLIAKVSVRILALFNPAGAILQAIEMIYRILSWVFEHAAELFALVESVVSGAAALVAGNIGAMASAVEGSLASMMAPTIDFLAGYIGLGNLPEQIVELVGGLQQQVEAVMNTAIGWLVEQGRAVLATLGLGGESESEAAPEGEFDGEVGERVAFTAEGEGHHTWIDSSGGAPKVMVASTPMTVEQRLADWTSRLGKVGQPGGAKLSDGMDVASVGALIAKARQISGAAVGEAAKVVAQPDLEKKPADDQKVEATQGQLVPVLKALFEAFGQAFALPEQVDPVTVTFNLNGDRGEFKRQLAMQQAEINQMTVATWRASASTKWIKEEPIKVSEDGPALPSKSAADLKGATNKGNKELDGFTKAQDGPDAAKLVESRTSFANKLTEVLQSDKPAALEAVGRMTGQWSNEAISYLVGRNGFVARTLDRNGGRLNRAAAASEVSKWMKTQDLLHSPDRVAGGTTEGTTGLGHRSANRSIGPQWKSRLDPLWKATREFLTKLGVDPPEKSTIRMNARLVVA